MKKLKVILKKSLINKIKNHRLTLKALGLTKIGQSRIYTDSPAIRGMVRKVAYMVEVEEIGDEAK